MKIGVDATHLLEAKHGISRYIRTALLGLSRVPGLELVLLADEETSKILMQRYAHLGITTAPTTSAKDGSYDLIWHPYSRLDFPSVGPQIVTIHDLSAFTNPPQGFFTARKARATLRRAARTADHILALSEWSARAISELLDVDASAISVVPPIPDVHWMPATTEMYLPEINDMPYVLFVGGWKKHQQADVMVRMFRRAFHKEEVRLVMCGPISSELQPHFERVPYRLHVHPTDHELRTLYCNAAAVVVLAKRSVFSSVAAEALACGAPLLANSAASLPEITGPAGVLVTAKSLQDWSTALAELVTDQRLQQHLRHFAVQRWALTSRHLFIDTLTDAFRRVAYIGL